MVTNLINTKAVVDFYYVFYDSFVYSCYITKIKIVEQSVFFFFNLVNNKIISQSTGEDE